MLTCWVGSAAATEPTVCDPRPDVRAEIERAMAVPVADPRAFDQNVSPFQRLRERFPDDLFVHESYQDAVQRYGVEGHLRVLTDQYQTLASEHSGDLMYRYLYARSLLGRGTHSAIQEMAEILALSPGFAPAHRMLAGIYSTPAFREPEREEAERKNFLQTCPGSAPLKFSVALPDRSPRIDRAERWLKEGGDPEGIADLAEQGLKDDEWRLQRIRPFDWYSVAFKIESQRELQAEYWRVWSLQVRCYRKAGQAEKAAQLLAAMEQRAVQFRAQEGNIPWLPLTLLVRLCAERNQGEAAERYLEALRKLVGAHPDPDRLRQIDELSKLIQTP